MNLDCYTQYIPLTSKARFWGNFVSALKGKTRDETLTRLTSLLRLKRPVRQSCPPREDILPLHRGGAAPGGDEAEAGVREARGPHVEEQARDLPASYSSPPRGQRQVRGSHCRPLSSIGHSGSTHSDTTTAQSTPRSTAPTGTGTEDSTTNSTMKLYLP